MGNVTDTGNKLAVTVAGNHHPRVRRNVCILSWRWRFDRTSFWGLLLYPSAAQRRNPSLCWMTNST